MHNFCRNCGVQLVQSMRFCTSCGASVGREDKGSHLNTPAYVPHQSTVSVRRNKKMTIITVVISLLLILLGIQNMSLSVLGKTATAKITDARLDTRSYGRNQLEPNRYRLKYEFSVDGERYAGNTTRIFKHGLASTQTIRVRYLQFRPEINSAASDAKVTGGLIIAGLGLLLLVLGIKGKISFGGQKK
jgi:hypothetical protein